VATVAAQAFRTQAARQNFHGFLLKAILKGSSFNRAVIVSGALFHVLLNIGGTTGYPARGSNPAAPDTNAATRGGNTQKRQRDAWQAFRCSVWRSGMKVSHHRHLLRVLFLGLLTLVLAACTNPESGPATPRDVTADELEVEADEDTPLQVTLSGAHSGGEALTFRVTSARASATVTITVHPVYDAPVI